MDPLARKAIMGGKKNTLSTDLKKTMKVDVAQYKQGVKHLLLAPSLFEF